MKYIIKHLIKHFTLFQWEQFGPFCTTYGSEPLLSDIKSWYLGSEVIFIVYSYQGFFEMDFSIAVRSSTCEGITNIYNLCK